MERIRDYNRSPHGRTLGTLGLVWEVVCRHRKCAPVLMNTLNKKRLYAINPFLIPLGRRLPKTKPLCLAMALLKPILKTKNSKARMLMIKYRGKITVTMVYDQKGIMDHFGIID